MHLTIGTRGSRLARLQTSLVQDQLRRRHPDLDIGVEIIRTQGDRTSAPLRSFGGRGVFTSELENALLTGQVDLAVHSLKDLPTGAPSELTVVATPEREDARDVLIAPGCTCLADLPARARVGTGSLRRRAQLLTLRPDLEICDLRGNLDRRLAQTDDGTLDAVILAAAGLHRLGRRERISCYLEPADVLPAPAQGALGLQMLRSHAACDLVAALDHPATHAAVAAERGLLAALGGGCHAPIGAWATVADGRLRLEGMVSHPDGVPLFRRALEAPLHQAEVLGVRLAEILREQGAARILAELVS